MSLIIVVIGVIGFGLIVVVHELGHFAAARASGVEVEAFSIGWGPRLFSWKRGGTEWRLSAIPLGGYCKMKGEEAFTEALQKKSETIPREPGTFYGAPAWKRIIISVSGPLANVVLAFVVYAVVSAIGMTNLVAPNRIVLGVDVPGSPSLAGLTGDSPAAAAGLKTGDRIVAIDGRPVADFSDLSSITSRSPGKALDFQVDRDGQTLHLTVNPALDKDSGAGRIGIYPYAEPLIARVKDGSPASVAGVRPGDRILAANGVAIPYTAALDGVLAGKPPRLVLDLERAGQKVSLPLVLDWASKSISLGLEFALTSRVERSASLGAALADGAAKTWATFEDTAHGMVLLFKGVNILKALSGPARIIYMTGSVAVDAVSEYGVSGLTWFFDILAFLSMALFIMNLLPIPALDGGMVVLFVAEILKGRPLKTTTIYRYQVVGMVLIMGLLALALFSDGNFFFPGIPK